MSRSGLPNIPPARRASRPGSRRIGGWRLAVTLTLSVLFLLDHHLPPAPRYQAEWLQAGDGHVRALRTGGGDTTILLLHGYGESLLSFRGLVGPLAAHYRVVALDLPGSGRSESPRGSYSLNSMVARLNDFLNRWTQGPVVVVGHSMGGEMAAALALRRPDRIVRCVLIAPAGYGLGFGLSNHPFSTSQQDLARRSLQARDLLIPVEDPGWIQSPPSIASTASSKSASRAAASAVLRDFSFTALKDRFRDLRQPTLLIWGRLDPLIPIAIGWRIAAELPCGRMVEIPNSWHRPHVEQPERVIREIRGFLAEAGHCR